MKKILTLSLIILLLVGCQKDFLDDQAYSVITQDNFYKTSNDALTAVNGVYEALKGNGMYVRELLWLNEIPSETVTTRLEIGQSNSRYDTWNWEVGDLSSIYSAQYRLIERANQVIANVPRVDMLESLKSRIIGEATFLRALAYFNLVRVYGAVPLKTDPTVNFSKTSFPRTSTSDIYSFIIGDLVDVLENAEIPQTSTYGNADKGRVGRSAVLTLLGKVYLTRASDPTVAQSGDYQKAVEYLQMVVTEGDRSLLSNFADVFSMTNENNAEVIFDIQYIRQNGLGNQLTAFLPTGTTQELYQISFYDLPASLGFYKSFEDDDLRRSPTFYDKMTVKISGQTVPVYFDAEADPATGTWRRQDNDELVPNTIIDPDVPGFRKFVDTDISARYDAEEPNYIIFRYADVLLMLAEANNEINNGPNAQAYQYLNMVRRRAFGKDINTPDPSIDYAGLTYEDFRMAIFTERRKELVIEGHSWFDGKRFWDIYTQKVAEESIGANPDFDNRPKQVIELNEIRNDKYKLLPFSVTQMELNSELRPQNPGYEQ